MARLPTKFLGPLSLASAVGTAALAAREHWRLLSPAERRRLAALLRASRGRVTALSAAERRELSELLPAARVAAPWPPHRDQRCAGQAPAARLRRRGPRLRPGPARPAAPGGAARGSRRPGTRLQTARRTKRLA